MTRSNVEGWIALASVVDAVNALPESVRDMFLAAMREREPGVLWMMNAHGRAYAEGGKVISRREMW